MLQFIGPVLKLSTVELVNSERIGILQKFIFICWSFWSCQDLIFLKDFKKAGGCRETASWRTCEVCEETNVIFKSMKRPVSEFKSLRTCGAQGCHKKRLEDPPGQASPKRPLKSEQCLWNSGSDFQSSEPGCFVLEKIILVAARFSSSRHYTNCSLSISIDF